MIGIFAQRKHLPYLVALFGAVALVGLILSASR